MHFGSSINYRLADAVRNLGEKSKRGKGFKHGSIDGFKENSKQTATNLTNRTKRNNGRMDREGNHREMTKNNTETDDLERS